MHNLTIVTLNYQGEPSWETFYTITGPCSSEVKEMKGRLRNSSRLKASKRKWQLNAARTPGHGLFAVKEKIGWVLRIRIITIQLLYWLLLSWFFWLYFQENVLLVGNTTRVFRNETPPPAKMVFSVSKACVRHIYWPNLLFKTYFKHTHPAFQPILHIL